MVAPSRVYPQGGSRPPTNPPAGERLSVRRAIRVVKEQVSCLDVADFHAASEGGSWRRVGPDRWTRRCIMPGHEDKTPSFIVYEATDSCWCFGCLRGGDAIDLERICGGHAETWTAVIELAQRYGVEFPRCPERWHRRQDDKTRQWHQLRDVLAASYQRRLFRVLGPVLAQIEWERREGESRAVWDALWPLAQEMAASRLYSEDSGWRPE